MYAFLFLPLNEPLKKPIATILTIASNVKRTVNTISMVDRIYCRREVGSSNGLSKARVRELTMTARFMT